MWVADWDGRVHVVDSLSLELIDSASIVDAITAAGPRNRQGPTAGSGSAGTPRFLDAEAISYDMKEVSVLRDHRGNEYRPSNWDGPTGGHHVFGYLRFDGVELDPPEGDGYVELVLSGIGGEIVRKYRWQM